MAKPIDDNTRDIMTRIDERVDAVFRHQSAMADYAAIPRTYGTNYLLTQTDAHVLLYIFREQGLTATRLAEITSRTKGTLSLIINYLEEQGLLYREVNPDNKRREYRLYPTDAGKHFCVQHLAFDRERTIGVMARTLQNCTPEELDAFYKVLGLRVEIFNDLVVQDKLRLEEYKKEIKPKARSRNKAEMQSRQKDASS